jgi:hypothetical protein
MDEWGIRAEGIPFRLGSAAALPRCGLLGLRTIAAPLGAFAFSMLAFHDPDNCRALAGCASSTPVR